MGDDASHRHIRRRRRPSAAGAIVALLAGWPSISETHPTPEQELPERASARPRTLEAGELAWVAAFPCALLTVAAILLLGPPLAHLLPAADPTKFWPNSLLAPEPVEHARFGIALLGPLLLCGIVVAGTGRVALSPRLAKTMMAMSSIALVGSVALGLLAQHSIVFRTASPPPELLNARTLTAALIFAPLIAVAVRRWPRPRLSGHARGTRDLRALRLACLLIAATLTAVWLLTAINVETTIGNAQAINLIPWDMGETFAVLDGRTPLVDFHAEYSQLIPYLSAAALAVFGSSMAVWTLAMTTLSGLGMLALYAVFRRLLRHPLPALALYLPVLALGFFAMGEAGDGNRFSPAGIFSAWPMRYVGPYLLAWLTARHLDGVAPRRAAPLFVAAGLVAINNLEFGLGAFGGTLLALALAHACRRPLFTASAMGRLLGSAALGLLGAALLVSALTLIRAGALPHFSFVLEFPHLYGVDGWFLVPMAPMGLHIALYVTFAAAMTLAIVRTVRRDADQLLTGMLAWSGVFGFGASSYFLGRSDILNLTTLFSAWSLALALLLVAVLRSLAARRSRFATLPQLAVLFGFGVAICSLPQLPPPWRQVTRLHHYNVAIFKERELTAFVARITRPGESVAILAPLGHRVAYDLDLTNVATYALPEAMPTRQQLQTTVEALRRAHGRIIVLGNGAGGEFIGALRHGGFAFRARSGLLMALTDASGSTRP